MVALHTLYAPRCAHISLVVASGHTYATYTNVNYANVPHQILTEAEKMQYNTVLLLQFDG
jgi:hypothetical protein